MLNGKTIYVGKDPEQSRLMVALVDGGQTLGAAIGEPGSVPACVSRCFPKSGTAHVKMEIDASGKTTITNLKDGNVTYVNGIEIVSKRIADNAIIELGRDRYRLDAAKVFSVAERMAASARKKGAADSSGKEFDISHLEQVWLDFQAKSMDRQKRQKKLGLLGSASLIFSLGGGALSVVAGQLGFGSIMIGIMPVLTIAGFVVCIVSFYLRSKDSSIEEAATDMEEFQDLYVCPNPDCQKFLGNYSYKLMKRQYSMTCPHCKCSFVENNNHK